MATIGFIGLGNMGAPMAANLVKAGHSVTGYDLVPAALQALAAAGGKTASSAAEAAKGADVVITMLPEGAQGGGVDLYRARRFPDEWVLLGNHHDAWEYGGGDPSSGTASMMELTRALGAMLKDGVRPRCTLVFCSWDGEEIARTGSTEWG